MPVTGQDCSWSLAAPPGSGLFGSLHVTTESTVKLSYRPEIDGMRAVAVLSVIVYHLKISIGDFDLAPGGFLGVDLFFVLSGYLITRIILAELRETDGVSIRNFYIRRARRILPPLLLVMLVSIPAALAILTPSQLERFGWSLVASLGFASNVFWYVEQGRYGASSALLEPFLHTWSLAIEEQYYLLFPVLLAAFHRHRPHWIGPALVLSIALGLAAAQLLTMRVSDLSFFSPTSRAWELLVGSLLAFAAERRPPPPPARPCLSSLWRRALGSSSSWSWSLRSI